MNQEPSAAPTPYWCFISYRHADNREQDRYWASWLHQEIERYAVPAELVGKTNPRGDVIPERIYPVFRDEESLPADADLANTIVNALNRSKFMAVLCSPKSVESTYVANEILHFKQQGREGKIIAAIIDGEPGTERECFPEPLRHPLSADGKLDYSVTSEPIAADFRLRNGDEGFTSAEGYRLSLQAIEQHTSRENDKLTEQYDQQLQLMKLKIIAGILGVPLEQLRNRDRAYQLQLAEKRTRTLRRWLTAVALLSLISVAGGIFAFIKQQEAVAAHQRTVSEMVDATWKAASLFTESGDVDHAQSSSYIEGTRAIYSRLRVIMDLDKLQSLSPVPIFLSGPHSVDTDGTANFDFNFQSYDFGRYNPDFVQWAYDNAIPGASNDTIRTLTQFFYDTFLKEMSRYYYIAYLDIQAELPWMEGEVIPQFLQELEVFRDVPFDSESMGTGPGHYLQYEIFGKYASQFSITHNTSIFDWSQGNLDYYFSNVAGAFWVRRMVDKTSEPISRLLLKLLRTYDSDWLQYAPEAQPTGTPGARRFPIRVEFQPGLK